MNWDVIVSYLPLYKDGLLITLYTGWFGILISIVLGLVTALIVHFKVPVLKTIAKIYIEILRNTPLLIQLFFIYYGIPKLFGIVTDELTCGIVGLGLLGGAYMAETFRSGIEAVDTIQMESALSLGMTRRQALLRVGLRLSMPQLVSVIGLTFAQMITGVMVVENLFALPGLGSMLITDVGNRDLIAVQSELFLLAAFFLLLGLAVDMAHHALDPRLNTASDDVQEVL